MGLLKCATCKRSDKVAKWTAAEKGGAAYLCLRCAVRLVEEVCIVALCVDDAKGGGYWWRQEDEEAEAE